MTVKVENLLLLNAVPEQTVPGLCKRMCWYITPSNREPLKALCDSLGSISDQSISEQVERFCDLLSSYLYWNLEITGLPGMVFMEDEGEAYFEWIFEGFRIGLLFCSDKNESGWFILFRDKDGKFDRIRGSFDGTSAVSIIMSFVEPDLATL